MTRLFDRIRTLSFRRHWPLLLLLFAIMVLMRWQGKEWLEDIVTLFQHRWERIMR